MLYEIDGSPAFRIHLYNNSVAHSWKKIIDSSYVGDGEDIDHKRTFFNLQTKGEIKKILLKAIKKINAFLKHEFIQTPHTWDQKTYNNLHITFERLTGEYDNTTRLNKIAPPDIKECIRDINYCVHALEHNNITQDKNNWHIHWTKGRETTQRIPLKENEYDYCQFNLVKDEVYLSYNEVGKSYKDLWLDELPINYSALKNNHYIGPDIFIALKNKDFIFDKKFITWGKKNNINVLDKKHGLGIIPIGKVEIIQIDQLTKDSKAIIIKE